MPRSAMPLPLATVAAPGTYFLANPGYPSDYKRVIFTLPAGWTIGDDLVYKHLGQPGEVAFSVWSLNNVYADPCHWQGSALSPLDIVNHTHDASGALIPGNRDGGLANQVGRYASALTTVRLGGELALRIELSVPTQLDLATCDRGEFRSWPESDYLRAAPHSAPGQIDVVYMVDVDRRALVIDASHMSLASEADLAELEAILASMTIER
jgi:hypothetical protein